MAEEKTEDLKASEQTVDPRLDNRKGDQRPPLETFPAKPQHIDGPDVSDEIPRPEEVAKNREEDGREHKGMKSPGPHGLGDTEAVPFDVANKTDKSKADKVTDKTTPKTSDDKNAK
jgi:hypothetical protein